VVASKGLTTTLERTNLLYVRSPTRRLLDHLIPEGIDVFVLERRSRGRSWRRIARDIEDATGIEVTHETVRSWFPITNGGTAA